MRKRHSQRLGAAQADLDRIKNGFGKLENARGKWRENTSRILKVVAETKWDPLFQPPAQNRVRQVPQDLVQDLGISPRMEIPHPLWAI